MEGLDLHIVMKFSTFPVIGLQLLVFHHGIPSLHSIRGNPRCFQDPVQSPKRTLICGFTTSVCMRDLQDLSHSNANKDARTTTRYTCIKNPTAVGRSLILRKEFEKRFLACVYLPNAANRRLFSTARLSLFFHVPRKNLLKDRQKRIGNSELMFHHSFPVFYAYCPGQCGG